jgi:RNA polymerase sigma factor (sigma-70 family)
MNTSETACDLTMKRPISNAERNARVLQYLPLARAMAYRANLPFDDAVQEATLGLIRAADRFDESRNTAFSTYARYWIAESLQRATIQALPVHVPLHVAKASHAKYKQAAGLAGKSEKVPEALAQRIGPAQRSGGLLAGGIADVELPGSTAIRTCVSTITKSGKTKNRRIDHDFAVSNIHAIRVEMENEEGEPLHGNALTQDAWPATENHIDADAIKTHFKRLSKRQRNALMLYFGIGGHDGYTLEEAGSIMGISREAVRQLIVRGLEILRALLQVEAA